MNKKIIQTRVFSICLLLILMLLLPISAMAQGAGTPLHASRHLQVSDDLQFGNVISSHPRGRQSAHYFSYLPGGNIRPIVSAGGAVFGARNINGVIAHAQGQGHNVLGGVNADFFSFQTGVPEGIYISNGQLRSSHHGRSAVFFREDGSAFVANPQLSFTLSGNSGTMNVPFFNKFRQSTWPVLFDSNFSGTTQTTAPGREVYFRIVNGSMRVGASLTLEVAHIVNSQDAVQLPPGYLVLSADMRSPYLYRLDRFAVGERVTLQIGTNDARVSTAQWATGGGDILVSGGAMTTGWDPGVAGVHPRTALGIRADGSVILYTIDGRIPGHSEGLTLTELAQEMISRGAVYVVNLDGGGSTTFGYRLPGTNSVSVLNRPSAGALRACATFILLTSTQGQGGGPAYIQFHPGHAQVLAGSSLTANMLSTQITMIDRGHFPLSTQGLGFDRFDGPPALGAPDGAAFVFGPGAASGRLNITATNGLTGQMNITVMPRPDFIQIRQNGAAINSLTLEEGAVANLSFHAMNAISGGSEILASANLFSASVTGNVGHIDAQGRFVAANTPGASGYIVVTVSGVERRLPVQISLGFPDVAGHWAVSYIESMRQAGVVSGVMTDGTLHFFPNRQVSRGEFSAMLARRLGLNVQNYSLSGAEFLDHNEIASWARPYVAAMHHHGLISGRPMGAGFVFDAGAPISRAEAFTILGRLLDASAPQANLGQFTDAEEIPTWARPYLARLVHAGMVGGTGDGRILPGGILSRAEAATILARLDLATLLGESIDEILDEQLEEEAQEVFAEEEVFADEDDGYFETREAIE